MMVSFCVSVDNSCKDFQGFCLSSFIWGRFGVILSPRTLSAQKFYDSVITLFSSRSNCFVIFVLLSFLTQAFGNISVSKTFLFFLIYIKIIFNLINYGQRMWSVWYHFFHFANYYELGHVSFFFLLYNIVVYFFSFSFHFIFIVVQLQLPHLFPVALPCPTPSPVLSFSQSSLSSLGFRTSQRVTQPQTGLGVL